MHLLRILYLCHAIDYIIVYFSGKGHVIFLIFAVCSEIAKKSSHTLCQINLSSIFNCIHKSHLYQESPGILEIPGLCILFLPD